MWASSLIPECTNPKIIEPIIFPFDTFLSFLTKLIRFLGKIITLEYINNEANHGASVLLGSNMNTCLLYLSCSCNALFAHRNSFSEPYGGLTNVLYFHSFSSPL